MKEIKQKVIQHFRKEGWDVPQTDWIDATGLIQSIIVTPQGWGEDSFINIDSSEIWRVWIDFEVFQSQWGWYFLPIEIETVEGKRIKGQLIVSDLDGSPYQLRIEEGAL